MGKLDSTAAAKAMRKAGLIPLEPYPGSNFPWRCRCNRCGSEVTPRYATVVGRGMGGCNICAKKAASETRRKAAEATYLRLLDERSLVPLEPYRSALAKWRIQCQVCNSIFQSSGNRIQQGLGCGKCGLERAGKQRRASGAKRAEGVMLASGLSPVEDYPGANAPWRCICLVCGAEVTPRFNGINQGQGGCRRCGIAKGARSRKLPDEDARKIMEAAGVLPNPDVEFPGAAKPWPSVCLTCGRAVSPTLGNIRSGHKGCKRCSMVEGGVCFDLWAPATVYLIRHDRLASLKIGISSDRNGSVRLLAHRNEGWVVLRTWNMTTGQQAVFIEGEVLRWWREDLGEAPSLSAHQMPQSGWTETIRIGVVTEKQIDSRVRSVMKMAHNLPPLPDKPHFGPLQCIAERNGEQCDRDAKVKNYCSTHYRRWRTFGDPWGGKWPSQEKSCVVEVEGDRCGKPIRSKDMCSVHYERWYTYGDPHYMKRPTPGTRSSTCVVEEGGQSCGERVIAREMCNKHYGHWKRHGDPLAGYFENPGQLCKVVENGKQCVRDATCRGMCGLHYNRWNQHGDPTVTLKRKAGEPIPPCQIIESGESCGSPVHARGMCRRHYRQKRA